MEELCKGGEGASGRGGKIAGKARYLLS